MQSFNFLFVNIVGFGCQLGYRVYMSWVSTDPSCTQIGRFLLIFFLALHSGANPFGNGLFQFPSRSQTLGLEFSIPVPVPKPSKVIPAHPCCEEVGIVEEVTKSKN